MGILDKSAQEVWAITMAIAFCAGTLILYVRSF